MIDIKDLIEKYKNKECYGIAAFLAFMLELEDEAEGKKIFRLMLRKMGVRQSKITDPIVFFSAVFNAQETKTVFKDEGIESFDSACGITAQVWDDTATKH